MLERFKSENSVERLGGEFHCFTDANNILGVYSLVRSEVGSCLHTNLSHFQPSEALQAITLIPGGVSASGEAPQVEDICLIQHRVQLAAEVIVPSVGPLVLVKK